MEGLLVELIHNGDGFCCAICVYGLGGVYVGCGWGKKLMLCWIRVSKELRFNSPTSYWFFKCFLKFEWGMFATRKFNSKKQKCIPNFCTFFVISVSLKTEKCISTKLYIYSCQVNCIHNFLLCLSLCYYFLKNIIYK